MNLSIVLLLYFIPVFTTVLIILCTYHLWKRWRNFQLFKDLGVPGPKPNLIYGNLMKLRGDNGGNLIKVMSNWSKQYGKYYGYFSGVKPILVVSEFSDIKKILIKDAHKYMNRTTMVISTKPLVQTISGLRDQRWKDVRSILSPTFSASKLKQLSPLMNNSLNTTIQILETEMCSKDDFDCFELYQGLTCDVICESALAMKVNCQHDPNDPFLSAVKGFLQYAISPMVFIAICFPKVGEIISRLIERFGFSGKMTQMICSNVEKVIKARREEKKKLPSNTKLPYADFLQFMLDTTDQANEGKRLSDDEIVANSWVFVLGGFETTGNALSFCTYCLACHPEVQERLFEELQQAFGTDEIPTYEQVNNLIYLDQVIRESLRLYPPVVSFIIRETSEPSQIGKWLIPPKTTVQIPIWEIHHDPNLWPNPYSFDPERFNPINRKSHDSLSWIPFGAGPRSCIGMRFALLETKFAIARIFRKFRFLPSALTEEQPALAVPTVSIFPKNGIHLKCERRPS